MTLSVLIYVMIVSTLAALLGVIVIDTIRGDASRRWRGAGRAQPTGERAPPRPECTKSVHQPVRRAARAMQPAPSRARGRSATARSCRR
jgi:hypothetical protein